MRLRWENARRSGTARVTVLQSPLGYTGDYSAWDIDLDNADSDDDLTTGRDNPWYFPTAADYPALLYGSLHHLAPQGRTLVDYDTNNNGLIDIDTLAQLDAIRYDTSPTTNAVLDGDGVIRPVDMRNYLAAFPNHDSRPATRMGCPNGVCTGYELMDDLDFDTVGDDDVADAPYATFDPLGGAYTADFHGNGHTISNLNVNTGGGPAGLFADTSADSTITAVGMINPTVRGTNPNSGIGSLAGVNSGRVYASYARGGSVTAANTGANSNAGGLVGRNAGALVASYTVGVQVANTSGTNAGVGGLTGRNYATTSSFPNRKLEYSYAASTVASTGSGSMHACLAPGDGNSVVTASYYNSTVCTVAGGIGAGRTRVQLLEPTGYNGIYEHWNADVDNADGDNDATTGGDDPWDIRVGHLPVLKYGGFDVDSQRPLTASAGADAEAYSGQPVTLSGSGRALASDASLAYAWTLQSSTDSDITMESLGLSGASTTRLSFTAPTGLTRDATLVFRLTVTDSANMATPAVYDLATVSIVAVRPNQLLSLSLADADGDAVGLAPPFVSLTYDYRASVANQISSVTVTPGVLANSTITLNGSAVSSGSGVDVPLNYRANTITIVVTPPEPEPSETTNGEAANGETANGDGGDEAPAEVTPCSVENDGVKPCTYTITVTRAVPPRLAFSARSLTIEEGESATYTVELDTPILTGPVTIAISSDNPSVTVSPSEVTLRPLDASPRTITVTAVSDADRNDETATITHTANGAHYYDVVATVSVKVNDTTEPPPEPDPALSVSVTSLSLAEGASGSYTVALANRPDGNVTLSIASDNADVTVRPATLSFTTANWATAQSVTATAAADGDTIDDAATLTHTASGGGYDDAPAIRVSVPYPTMTRRSCP